MKIVDTCGTDLVATGTVPSRVCSNTVTLTFSAVSALGCFYNGRIYGHGEQWQDGCDYNCTCVNGQTGYYRCGARYV